MGLEVTIRGWGAWSQAQGPSCSLPPGPPSARPCQTLTSRRRPVTATLPGFAGGGGRRGSGLRCTAPVHAAQGPEWPQETRGGPGRPGGRCTHRCSAGAGARGGQGREGHVASPQEGPTERAGSPPPRPDRDPGGQPKVQPAGSGHPGCSGNGGCEGGLPQALPRPPLTPSLLAPSNPGAHPCRALGPGPGDPRYPQRRPSSPTPSGCQGTVAWLRVLRGEPLSCPCPASNQLLPEPRAAWGRQSAGAEHADRNLSSPHRRMRVAVAWQPRAHAGSLPPAAPLGGSCRGDRGAASPTPSFSLSRGWALGCRPQGQERQGQ